MTGHTIAMLAEFTQKPGAFWCCSWCYGHGRFGRSRQRRRLRTPTARARGHFPGCSWVTQDRTRTGAGLMFDTQSAAQEVAAIRADYVDRCLTRYTNRFEGDFANEDLEHPAVSS